MDRRLQAFKRLLDIMDDLREKCPWDQKQTFESLRKLTIEETYELADAITEGDKSGIEEEVGDLLLHMVFYAKIGSETGDFDIESILNRISDKLVERHPHIYADVVVEDEEDVKRNWEMIKLKTGKKTLLGGVPKSLPAMVKAHRLQEKTAQVGFEWKTTDGVWEKMREEMDEFQQAIDSGTKQEQEEELGDILFNLVNLSRYYGLDPENALAKTNQKFKSRFDYIESHADKPLKEMSLEEMENLWQEAKKS